MSDRTVTLTLDPDDVIDAIGSLELRAMNCRAWANEWGDACPGVADERRQRADHYDAVVRRLREAMERANR